MAGDGGGGGSKRLFLAIYAAVAAGVLFCALFILSTLYFPTPTPSSTAAATVEAAVWKPSSSPPSSPSSPPPIPTRVSTNPIWTTPPTGSPTPDPNEFRLTEEMVRLRTIDNTLIITFGNFAFMDFILNWVRHLTDLHLSNLLVGAMDTKLLEALYWKGVPVFDMGSHMNTMDVGWGSPTFHKMGREKVFLINALLPFGVEFLMCDTDMVWIKNPLPYLARFPEADILTSSDQVVPTVTDDSLEVWKEVSGSYNIGIFHWRPTEPARRLAKEWKDMLLADEKLWDQTGFNDLMHKHLGPSVEGEEGLVYAYDGSLKLGILAASIFCSGHTYFVQAMHEQLRLEPYAVHTTFQYAGTEGKRHRLREAMLFFDQPEYYDSPGGFLSFNPRIPKSLLLDGEHTLESHFLLVNFQLKQIRTALAIALLLNRTLVMPQLWCRFDRMWFGHPGKLEGTITRQPFLCPMDHVFEVHVMLQELSEAEFGPRINFKEYSFLRNPLLSKQAKESLLEVQLCNKESPKCQLTNHTAHHGILELPKHSSQEKLVQVFSEFKDVKTIYFSTMVDAFEGFTDKAMEAKFRKRVKRYTGIWCCITGHDPGHIYYDMYWDEKPGWKPEPPKSREDDRPPL